MGKIRIDRKTLNQSMKGERISLDNLGYSAERIDRRKLSYIRGYIHRKYGYRINPPLDAIILFMVYDALTEQARLIGKKVIASIWNKRMLWR